MYTCIQTDRERHIFINFFSSNYVIYFVMKQRNTLTISSLVLLIRYFNSERLIVSLLLGILSLNVQIRLQTIIY